MPVPAGPAVPARPAANRPLPARPVPVPQKPAGAAPLVSEDAKSEEEKATLAEHLTLGQHLDVDDARPLLVDVQHRGGVHDQAEVGEDRRPALVEVGQQLDGADDLALGVPDAQPDRRGPDRAAR